MPALISAGLSIAEGFVNQNWSVMFKNLFVGILLGALGGFLVSLFANQLYQFMGGGHTENFATQVLARTVTWGIVGLFVAIAPGILMLNFKKLILGLIGGLLGGLLGGVLFDVIANTVHGAAFPRFVGIVSFGILAGVFTALLENAVKQGWLKIQSGLIAGKQFIIYKNPTTIGSSPKCDIYLFKDPSVGGIHAAIHTKNGQFILCSQAGLSTTVNGQPIQEKTLKNGDLIQIGITTLRFEAKKQN